LHVTRINIGMNFEQELIDNSLNQKIYL
jgi:hypothetical protein